MSALFKITQIVKDFEPDSNSVPGLEIGMTESRRKWIQGRDKASGHRMDLLCLRIPPCFLLISLLFTLHNGPVGHTSPHNQY